MEGSRDVRSSQAGGSELAASLSSHSFGHKASPDSGGGINSTYCQRSRGIPSKREAPIKEGWRMRPCL